MQWNHIGLEIFFDGIFVLAFLWLGVLNLSRWRNRSGSISLFFFTLILAFWFGVEIFRESLSLRPRVHPETVRLYGEMARLSLAGLSLAPTAFFSFLYFLLGKNKYFGRALPVSLFSGLFAILVLYFGRTPEITFSGLGMEAHLEPGLSLWPVAGLYALGFIYALIFLKRTAAHLSGPVIRQQISLLWMASWSGLFSTIFFLKVIGLPDWGLDYPVFLLLVIFLYNSLFRFHMVNPRESLREIGLWLLTATLMIFPVSLLMYFIGRFTWEYLPRLSLLVFFALLYILYFFFDFIHPRLARIFRSTQRSLWARVGSYKNSLLELKDPLVIGRQLDELIGQLYLTTFHSLYMWREQRGGFGDINDDRSPFFTVFDPFILWLTEEQEFWQREAFLDRLRENREVWQHGLRFFEKTGAELILPLILNQSLIGIVIIGKKMNGEAFHQKDYALLKEIKLATSIALSNALLYQRIRGLNESLEQKVEARTRELKEAQQKLILSEKMASLGTMVAGIAHEINTPAAVIQGSVSNNARLMEKMANQLGQIVSRDWPADYTEQCVAYFHQAAARSDQRKFQDTRTRMRRKKELREHSRETNLSLSEPQIKILTEMDTDLADGWLALTRDHPPELALFILNAVQLAGNLANSAYGIESITRIVRALKSYSHLDQSDETTFGIQEGLETTLVILNNQIKYGPRVETDFQSSRQIRGYVNELNQVWTNLITNAVQALEEKFGDQVRSRGRLTIRARDEGDWVVVELEDNGPGISEEVQAKIWDPFFTTKDQGRGTGLGLGIVQNILEKHRGLIACHSEPGKGARFTIKIPAIAG